MLVQLCVVVCGDGCSSCRFCLNMSGGKFVCSELCQGTTGCFGVMYGEWYGVCDFVVLSVVDYGGVNVFHVCLTLHEQAYHDTS